MGKVVLCIFTWLSNVIEEMKSCFLCCCMTMLIEVMDDLMKTVLFPLLPLMCYMYNVDK